MFFVDRVGQGDILVRGDDRQFARSLAVILDDPLRIRAYFWRFGIAGELEPWAIAPADTATTPMPPRNTFLNSSLLIESLLAL
jgi:hypothetical protein